jgi:hypothetical protein
MLESMLTGEDVPAPPDLFEHYPEALRGLAHPVPANELRSEEEPGPAQGSLLEEPPRSGQHR